MNAFVAQTPGRCLRNELCFYLFTNTRPPVPPFVSQRMRIQFYGFRSIPYVEPHATLRNRLLLYRTLVPKRKRSPTKVITRSSDYRRPGFHRVGPGGFIDVRVSGWDTNRYAESEGRRRLIEEKRPVPPLYLSLTAETPLARHLCVKLTVCLPVVGCSLASVILEVEGQLRFVLWTFTWALCADPTAFGSRFGAY